MVKNFRAIWDGLLSLFDDILKVMLWNVFWVFVSFGSLLIPSTLSQLQGEGFSLPAGDDNVAFALLMWFFIFLPVILISPATVGLYYATNQLAHREDTNWRTFFSGMRQYFWMGYRWMLLTAGVLVVLIVNIYFYARMPEWWAIFPWVFSITVTVIWILVNIYTLPLLFEQQERKLKIALRNSLVLWARYPGYSVLLVLLLGVLGALSVFLQIALLVLTVGVFAFLQNYSVIHLIEEMDKEQKKNPPKSSLDETISSGTADSSL